jgi:hypothetical protein
MLPISTRSSPRSRGSFRSILLQIMVSALLSCVAAAAQTVTIEPAALERIPAADVGDGRFWQQLRIVLAHDDAASSETVSIDLPEGIIVSDTDRDGALFDEVRIVYRAVESELPRFQAATVTSVSRIVIESQERAGAGGELYVQFPIFSTASPTALTISYRGVQFADSREQDLSSEQLPLLSFVDSRIFNEVGSMGLVDLAAPLAAGVDTTTTARGTWFPSAATQLVLSMPDLVFDAGLGSPNVLPGHGDGDDANDTHYRFFFSSEALLSVDASVAVEALRVHGATDTVYTENEGEGGNLQLVTRDLPAGSYWLYVTADATGGVPLGRSRVVVVRHEPVIERLGPTGTEPLTFDSGGLLDTSGTMNGLGIRRFTLDLSVVDHDDSARVHLFYSGNPNLGPTSVLLEGETAILLGAESITELSGLAEETVQFDWNTAAVPIVPAGDYYLYAIAVGGGQSTVDRTTRQILVRHAPFLRLDTTLDGGVSDSIITGGVRPQRFASLSWGRSGAGGDGDVDDDASIDLYYSDRDDFALPTDAAAVEAAAAASDQDTHAIVVGLGEDADSRNDNLFVWDLWSLEAGGAVPTQGTPYAVYGVIADSEHRRLVRMNGGTLGDAGSWIRFDHQPVIRPVQPVADLNLDGVQTARVSWQDMDLDDDARIRIVLSAEDHGAVTGYDEVTAGLAFVVNSADGRAAAEVDTAFDLSEDSNVDYLDVGTEQLTRSLNADGAPQPGTYTVYLAITQQQSFNSSTRAWRAPGRLIVTSPTAEDAATPFKLFPEAFTVGNGGGSQTIDVVVDAAADTIDLVLLTMRVDGARFSLRDFDSETAGIQPFVVAPGFSASKLVTNSAVVEESGGLFLTFEYFDPVPAGIPDLDGGRALVRFDLIATEGVGAEPIQLVADLDNNRPSQLERSGVPLRVAQVTKLATALVVPGRATVGGRIVLEGRADRAAVVEVALRRWGEFADMGDSLFAATNDEDKALAGVQISLDTEGDFALLEVPTGRLDLHLRRPGYLEGRASGLELYPGAIVEDVRPSSSGVEGDSVLHGGDVAGYDDTSGVSLPDNEITIADWDFIAALFSRQVTAEDDSARADISGDGVVNIRDLSLVGANFRKRGPRPVYRSVARSSAPISVRLEINSDNERVYAVGDTVTMSLHTESALIHASQADLHFDSRHWQQINATGSPGALATEARSLSHSSIASAAIGSQPLSTNAPLASWSLVARQHTPATPVLGELLLLDVNHHDLQILSVVATAVTEPHELPASFALQPNYPNPFNPNTAIGFSVPDGGAHVRLEVFDALGQRIAVLAEGRLVAGTHSADWNGRDLRGRRVASGVYFARLFTHDAVHVRPMLLLR